MVLVHKQKILAPTVLLFKRKEEEDSNNVPVPLKGYAGATGQPERRTNGGGQP